ncbi:hypothetical protein [Roseiconus lacunae]|uniref:hypothetical protein n=1 Tax=Roseiconus lacunae TaxID=2605694 RepID=UPI001E2EB13F|nr:hypothetical protein [Roseiconus lacunae]MCD0459478.1 hypothetical protein [Roseiconus lacunae]
MRKLLLDYHEKHSPWRVPARAIRFPFYPEGVSTALALRPGFRWHRTDPSAPILRMVDGTQERRIGSAKEDAEEIAVPSFIDI